MPSVTQALAAPEAVLYCTGGIAKGAAWTLVFWVCASCGLALAAAFEAVATPQGSFAIFRDDIPVDTVHPDPEMMGRVLENSGYRVDFLDAARLGDPADLSRARYDVLVVPYGASFPRSVVFFFFAFFFVT